MFCFKYATDIQRYIKRKILLTAIKKKKNRHFRPVCMNKMCKTSHECYMNKLLSQNIDRNKVEGLVFISPTEEDIFSSENPKRF